MIFILFFKNIYRAEKKNSRLTFNYFLIILKKFMFILCYN